MPCNTHAKGGLEKIKCQPYCQRKGPASTGFCLCVSLGSAFMKLMLLAALCRQDATIVGIVFVLT